MATTKPPVELKVKVAGAFSFFASTVILAVLGAVDDAELIKSLPDWLSAVAGGAVTSAITWFSAYRADHTPRPDLRES